MKPDMHISHKIKNLHTGFVQAGRLVYLGKNPYEIAGGENNVYVHRVLIVLLFVILRRLTAFEHRSKAWSLYNKGDGVVERVLSENLAERLSTFRQDN